MFEFSWLVRKSWDREFELCCFFLSYEDKIFYCNHSEQIFTIEIFLFLLSNHRQIFLFSQLTQIEKGAKHWYRMSFMSIERRKTKHSRNYYQIKYVSFFCLCWYTYMNKKKTQKEKSLKIAYLWSSE
jgi:hypothetical protein